MRILIANDQHWPMKSGVSTAARTLAQGLAKQGHKVMVLAPSQNGRSYKETDENYSITRIRSLPLTFRKNLRVAVTYEREVANVLKDFRPDIVHVHTQLTIGLTTLRAAKSLGIPVVATNHVMPENMVKNIKALAPVKRPATYMMNEYGVLLYKGAKRIIVPTQSVIQLFNLERLDDAPAMAISNGIDLSQFTPRKPKKYIYDQYDVPRDKKIICWLGRLDKEKHLNVGVEAFAKLCKKRDDVHLLMIGTGNDESDLIDLVESLGIADTVTFTGMVSEEDKLELHRVTDIFIVPSPNELQCLAMLESMACGKPVVAVDAGALAELVIHDVDGYLVTTDDVDGFVRAISMILDDDERRARFGVAARKMAEQHDTAKVIPRFVEMYKEVIAENPKPKKRSRWAIRNEPDAQPQE